MSRLARPIAGLLEDFLDFALGTPHLYTFLMVERREHARRFPDDFVAGASPSFGRVTEVVEQGMREGVLRADDPLEVTLALTAQGQGLITMYLGAGSACPSRTSARCARARWAGCSMASRHAATGGWSASRR